MCQRAQSTSIKDYMNNIEDEITTGFLIEQWKTSVDFAKDISNRRLSVNCLFLTGLSLLLSGILFGNSMINLNYSQFAVIVISICIIGIILCALWIRQLEYYRLLIITKYNIIREIEQFLPVRVYTYENDSFYVDNNKSFSKAEKHVPMSFGVIFLIILVVVLVPVVKALFQ